MKRPAADRRVRVLLVAFVTVLGVVATAVPALANHGGNDVLVGLAEDGTVGEFFDAADKTAAPGTTVTFTIDNAFHDVTWDPANPGGAFPTLGPGGPGTTGAVTLASAGTYYYWCELHANQGDAQAEDWAAAALNGGQTGKMVGRIVVVADTTAPTWNNANPVVATPDSASQITLTWPPATDDSGSVFFDVFQNTANDRVTASLVGNNVSGLSFADTGLTAGQTYWYWVAPVDGAGNAGPERTASATTSAVAASATATGVVAFSVDTALAISVTAANLGTGGPPSTLTGTSTVTIQSNDTWSLSLKSIGRDGVDDAPGDDAVFTSDGATTIPVSKAAWSAAGGNSGNLSDVDAVALTGQPASASANVDVDYSVTLAFGDPAGSNYRTTVLYTVTQP